jgi:hypothetical protein
MLAVTGGRERSEREWRTLLEAAGFILTGVYPVGGDNLMDRNERMFRAAKGSFGGQERVLTASLHIDSPKSAHDGRR